MLKLDKAIYIQNATQDFIKNKEVIRGLFEDVPELKEFAFVVSNEYDDSNYSDYSHLQSINGYKWDYGYDTYEEVADQEEEKNENEKISDEEILSAIRTVVDIVGKEFGYDEHLVKRENFISQEKDKQNKKDKFRNLYIQSVVSGIKIEENKFINQDPAIALYYADDNGRFSEEVEFKIFAKKSRMDLAYEYAKNIIKGPLPESIENFFINPKTLLNPDTETRDHKYLKKYLEFKKSIEK